MRPKKVYPPEMAATDANALDRHSPIPLYQQLCDVLSRQIKQGILKPGDGLPSEYELTHRYGVSRYVVRQTLASLSRQGLIYTEQGRGSFVSYRRIDKALSLLQSYHKNMREAGLRIEVQIIRKEIIPASDEVAEELGIEPGERVFHLERVSSADGVPINVLSSDIYLPGPQLELLGKFPGGSLYEYLTNTCHVTLDRAYSALEVGFAGEQESRLLNARLQVLDRSAPQLQTLQMEITALESQIVSAKDRLAGTSSSSISELDAKFREIQLNLEFITNIYKSNLNALEQARLEAARRLKFLIIVSEPSVPERAEYPRRGYLVATAAAVLMVMFFVVSLTTAIIREHS